MILNNQGYDPIDDCSDSGYRRPPRDGKCINDYFYELGKIEDGGEFAAAEMMRMLDSPIAFFSPQPNEEEYTFEQFLKDNPDEAKIDKPKIKRKRKTKKKQKNNK